MAIDNKVLAGEYKGEIICYSAYGGGPYMVKNGEYIYMNPLIYESSYYSFNF